MNPNFAHPRRPFLRNLMRYTGRGLLSLLARSHLTGRENFPKTGPLIIVGNHTGALEVVMLTAFSPWIIEYIGSVDIPHEPLISAFINAYGFIPIFRGRASRAAMQAGLDVLNQGGFLGIFPEGGIWEPSIHRAHTGVAWFSYHAQAPILPVGFSSARGALNRVLALKRPRLTMNVGSLLPPVQIRAGIPRKSQFDRAAQSIMAAVTRLIPEDQKLAPEAVLDERFELEIAVVDYAGNPKEIPPRLQPQFGPYLSKLIHRTTLFNNLLHNLKLPVAPIRDLSGQPPAEDLLEAASAVLAYLEDKNPFYFTYRYGQQEGSAFQKAIRELHDLAEWALASEFRLSATPIRRYRTIQQPGEIVERRPVNKPKW